MRKYRMIFLGVLLTALSAALMAGGGQAGEPAGSTGPVVIDFMHSAGGKAGTATTQLVESFNKSQNEVIVEANYGGSYDDAVKKLLAAIVAGDPPAVVHLATTYIPQFLHYEALESLSPYFKNDSQLKESDFIPTMLDICRYKGEVYGLPYNYSNLIMYYNKDLFKAVGLDPEKPPLTWDDIYEYGKKISALGDDIYGVNLNGTSGWVHKIYTSEFGGKWIKDDNSGVLWTEPEPIEAAAFIKKMVDEKVAVYQGTSAMNFSGKNGIWFASTADLTNAIASCGFELGVSVMPYKAKKSVYVGGGSLFIFKAVAQEKKDAGWKFLKFMNTLESQLFFSEQTGYQACLQAAINSARMLSRWKQDPRFEVTYKQLDYTIAENWTFLVPYIEIRRLYVNAWDEIILKNVDPRKALADYQVKANQVIAEAAAESKK